MIINPYVFGAGSALELTPLQGTFSKVATIDLFEVCPPSLVEVTDDFTSDNWTRTVGSGTPTFTVSGGQGTASLSSGSSFIVLQSTLGGSLTIPQFWAEIQIDQVGTGSTNERVGIGFTKDINNRITCEWERGTNQMFVSCRHNGGSTSVLSVASGVTISAGYKIGISMVSNMISVWTCAPGGTWAVRGSRDVSGIRDFRLATNYASFVPTLTFTGGSVSTWKVSNFKTGRYGSLGLKDPMVIYRRDGTPLIDGDGRVLFSTTALHPNVGTSTRGLYTAIYAIDLDTYDWEQVGVVFFNRESKIINDINFTGVEKADGTYQVFSATWANPSGTNPTANAIKIQTGGASASDFVGSHILNMSDVTLPIPSGGAGWYDPSVVWDGARYLIAFAVTNSLTFSPEKFYPVLAESADLGTWTSLADDSAQSAYEGPFLYRANTSWYVLASRRGSPPVYDDAMSALGFMSAALDFDSDTIPHPILIAHGSKRKILTFSRTRSADGYSARRDLIIWEADRYA